MMARYLIIGLALLCPPAHAYSISTHVTLTKRAVEEYEICRKTNGLKALAPEAAEILARANVYEDYAFWNKARNWHFYHPFKDLDTGTLGLANASLRSRFEALEKQVQNEHSLQALGGLIHYVQDITNPAHVAPVFHLIGDSFDNYDFESAFPALISEAECIELAKQNSQKQTYFAVFDGISRVTLARMDETFQFSENGLPRTMQWKEAFWNTDVGTEPKRNAFGQYGKLGNNFGSTKIKNATIDPKVYADFAQQQIRAALNGTIVFIEIYQNSIGSH